MAYNGRMKAIENNQTEQIGSVRYTREERDSAFNIAIALYNKWQNFQKDEIIEMDKTFNNNEEPNGTS